ncbi:MAG: mechanosensitive ion channel family protein [Synechococcales bacterium]|nr:mechanosensitive ion channel family protein [Synechococcales bacterium]
MSPLAVSDFLQVIQESLLEILQSAVIAVPALILAIAILAATWYGTKPIRRLVSATSERFIHNATLRTLAVQLAVVGVWVTGTLLACLVIFPGLALGDIIGLLGLSSVAIGFAFQDIFKNFLAGILLLLNQPFQLNDQIVVQGFEGTVEEISIRSTKIRTYQGERVVIPNSLVFTNPIHVLTHYPHRRTDLAIGLDYNTPLARARQVLAMAMTDVEGVLSQPSVEIDIVGFGDSAIDFIVRYWTRPEKVHVRQIQSRVMVALKQACDEAEFNIPYPIRSVYYFDQEKFNDHYPEAAIATQNGH